MTTLNPGQQCERAQIDEPTVFMCVWHRGEKKKRKEKEDFLLDKKTEAPSQQHDKPIYCCYFEKLTGPQTHTHTGLNTSDVPLFLTRMVVICGE